MKLFAAGKISIVLHHQFNKYIFIIRYFLIFRTVTKYTIDLPFRDMFYIIQSKYELK